MLFFFDFGRLSGASLGPLWVCLVLSGASLWGSLGLPGALWGLSGILCGSLELSEALWGSPVLSGDLWE